AGAPGPGRWAVPEGVRGSAGAPAGAARRRPGPGYPRGGGRRLLEPQPPREPLPGERLLPPPPSVLLPGVGRGRPARFPHGRERRDPVRFAGPARRARERDPAAGGAGVG